MKPRKSAKPYWEMNTAELARATAEFDKEFAYETFKPLSPASGRQWERIRRKPGRPKVGKGALAISVTVERDLLRRADALAKELRITRARLVARGLKAVLAAEGRI